MYLEKKSTAIIGPHKSGKTQHMMDFISEVLSSGNQAAILNSKRGDKYSRFNGQAQIYTYDFEEHFDKLIASRAGEDTTLFIFMDDLFEMISEGFQPQKLLSALENKDALKIEIVVCSQVRDYLASPYRELWNTVIEL